MPRVLVSDPIAPEGIELLNTRTDVKVKTGLKPEELVETIENYDALVVRSETKVTPTVIEAGQNLKVIARAGIGVDNIDLNAATNAGIAVVNAPIGNTVAAAEHSLALMLALARNIPQAYQSLKDGEWRRSAFMGIEVRNKYLGVVGLGRVGSEVARRAASFGMHLLAYDPFVGADYARRLGAELLPLDELLTQSDFVTLHTPLTTNTANLIGTRELALMKPDARLINVARGELIDEEALLEALGSGTPGRRGPGRICPGTTPEPGPGEPSPGDGHAPPGRVHPGGPAGGGHRGGGAGAGGAGGSARPQHGQRSLHGLPKPTNCCRPSFQWGRCWASC